MCYSDLISLWKKSNFAGINWLEYKKQLKKQEQWNVEVYWKNVQRSLQYIFFFFCEAVAYINIHINITIIHFSTALCRWVSFISINIVKRVLQCSSHSPMIWFWGLIVSFKGCLWQNLGRMIKWFSDFDLSRFSAILWAK